LVEYFTILFSGFTGIDAPFEPPENPDLVLKAGETSVNECVQRIVNLLTEKV
jgi:adenylylsulfate kinase-like enzyme